MDSPGNNSISIEKVSNRSSRGAKRSKTSSGKKSRSSSKPSNRRQEPSSHVSVISNSLQDLHNDIVNEYPRVHLTSPHGKCDELPEFVHAVQTSRGFISKESENKRIAASFRLSEKLNHVSDQDFDSKVGNFFDRLSALAQGLLAGTSLWQLLQVSTSEDKSSKDCALIKTFHGVFYFFSALAILQLLNKTKERPPWKVILVILAFVVGTIANSLAAQEDDRIFFNCTATLVSNNSTVPSEYASALDWHSLNSSRTTAAIIGFVFSIIFG